jgi:hypothetical protein
LSSWVGLSMSEQKLPLFWLIAVPVAVTAMALPVIVALVAILLLWFVHLWNIPFWSVCVLGGILIVGGTIVVWRAMRGMARRRFQFSIRSMLISTAVFALVLSLLGNRLHKMGRQQQALVQIAANGGFIRYYIRPENWMQKYRNFDPFQKVEYFEINSDRAIPAILDYGNEFPELLSIGIYPGVSDAGLERAEEFCRFPNFMGFGLDNANITDAGMEQLSKCTKLKRLSINGAGQITDNSLKYFVDLPNLDDLWLLDGGSSPPITDAGLQHVGKMTKLKRIIIQTRNSLITDAGLKHLQNLQNLEYLSIGSNKITEQGTVELGIFLPDCFIRFNDKIITQQFKRLEIYETQPSEKLIKSITDQERIAKIIDYLEFEQSNIGWQDVKGRTIPVRLRLDFLGGSRRLYQMRLVNNGVINQWDRSYTMSEQEEKELLRLLEIETSTKPSP